MLLLALVAVTMQVADTPPIASVEGVGRLWIYASLLDGDCTFALTDAIESAAQLRETLRDYYDPASPVDLVVTAGTPRRCVAKGQRVLRRAGFEDVRLRPDTDLDARTVP